MPNNSLVKKKQTGIATYLTQEAVRNQVVSIVGSKNGDQFVASVVSAVQANPELQKCSNQSILSAALLGQSLKLSPSPQLGQFYIVPYKNNAQFQLGLTLGSSKTA